MTEKTIRIDDIPLVDFLGPQNKNIKHLSKAFPKSKIISRGNEIKIVGSQEEIEQIISTLNSLMKHFNRYGNLTPDEVDHYLFLDGNEVSEQQPGGSKDGGDVIVYGNRGNSIKPKSPNQKKLVDAVYKNDLVFALGPAGTGKTYISVALAVRALKNKEVKKIIISRPAVEAGEHLGFLPGDLKEKVDPYLRPIYDALDDMIPPEKLKFYQETRVIEIAPLAYMRGRTLNNAYILLDEAQNTTMNQIKMFLTRMGPNSKMIVTGDQSQVDLPVNQRSGLMQAATLLKGMKGVGVVELKTKDVIRHKLVIKIIEAFEKEEAKSKK